jgi:hypothetical protein
MFAIEENNLWIKPSGQTKLEEVQESHGSL